MAKWIDFKELREKLRFVDVLSHYGVQLKIKGDRATGLCPLPTHPHREDGKPRSASFSAHLAKGIWRCFGGCEASGNCIDFGVRMQGLDPDDPVQFRQGALKLVETFGISFDRPSSVKRSTHPIPELGVTQSHPSAHQPPDGKPALFNQPIDFELKNLDSSHGYLTRRGFTAETIRHFGLGFCARGLMKDRIAIPIHDASGSLIGYAGRLVDDSRIDDDHPRYLFPGPRERDGVVHEFRKGMLVYNLHRLQPDHDLIVVEGFTSVWWLHQLGYDSAIALMGSSCSVEQADLIDQALSSSARISLLPDGDVAGKQLASQALPLLARRHFTRLIELDDGQQPTDLSIEQMRKIFAEVK